jgi:hypothetical protein
MISRPAAEVAATPAPNFSAAIWAVCALAGTLQNRHRLGGSRQIARFGPQLTTEKTTFSTSAPSKHRRHIRFFV